MLRAVLDHEVITVTQDGKLLAAFYAGDHFGLDRLKDWVRAHRDLGLTNEQCTGFKLKHEPTKGESHG